MSLWRGIRNRLARITATLLATADHRDSRRWEFHVVAERDLPEQKSIALKVLQDLTSPCDIDALAPAVDAVAGACRWANGPD